MKLSKRLLEVVETHQDAAEWCADIAERLQDRDEALPSHFYDAGHGSEYYRGLVRGHETAIESILMAHNCYAGFSYGSSANGGAYNRYSLSKAQ